MLPIKFCGGVVAFLSSLADLVNLLVYLSPVVVSILTSTGNGVRHPSRMPSTDTGDLAETPVGFAGKTGDTPTGDHTFVPLTLGDANDVNHFILLKDGIHRHLLLKKLVAIVNLVCNGATVNLDLHEMGLLLLQNLHLSNLKSETVEHVRTEHRKTLNYRAAMTVDGDIT